MRKIITAGIFWCFFISSVLPQDREFSGGHFLKRVEYNLLLLYDLYNLNSKGDVEKLFFGDFNSPVEFSFLPSSEAAFVEQPSGFRIVKDTSNISGILEVKYISNYPEANREASKKYPSIGVSISEASSMTDSLRNQIREHNRTAFGKRNEEMLKLFKVEILTLPVSNQFVEKMYEKMVLFIDNFKAKGVPPIISDGYRVVFRNVVEDEVWSLNIHMPQGDALKMADLCRQIITDAKENQLDEAKYISVLETFEYK